MQLTPWHMKVAMQRRLRHLKRRNEQYVRTNVAERRCRKEVERRFGIAKRGEYARCNIIEEHKRKSENVYAEIQLPKPPLPRRGY